MAANVREIKSRDEFNQITESGAVLVDFYATWCGPCRMQLPILEQVASETGEIASIVKVNVDQLPELAQKYRVNGIPHLVLLNDGKVFEEFVGLQQQPTLTAAIREAAGTTA